MSLKAQREKDLGKDTAACSDRVSRDLTCLQLGSWKERRKNGEGKLFGKKKMTKNMQNVLGIKICPDRCKKP